MTYQFIEVVREDHLTIVTIDRPDARNALHLAAHVELEDAFNAFASDSDQWIAILTASGEKAFCAGHDLKQQAAGGGLVLPPTGFAGLTSRFDLTKPVIAAVNGVALGGGFEAALACDLIVSHSQAVFALPEPRVGLAALAGGIQRLPRAIGLQRAMGIMLTGRHVTAHEGHAMGFVHEVSEDNALTAARKIANDLLVCSPLALRATKDAVLRGLTSSMEDAISAQWTYPAMQAMLASRDAIEGPLAFTEKRSPLWKGN